MSLNIVRLLLGKKLGSGLVPLPEDKEGQEALLTVIETVANRLLTNKLQPALATDARIINVSSTAYQFAAKTGLQPDNLNAEQQYGPWSSYGQSKLANILFTQELQRRTDQAGKSYTVTALHPGAVATDLGRYLVGEEQWNAMKTSGTMTWQQKLVLVPLSKLTKTVPVGANTQVYLAADPVSPAKGAFYQDQHVVDNLPPFARDSEAASTLWTLSEQMTGSKFDL